LRSALEAVAGELHEDEAADERQSEAPEPARAEEGPKEGIREVAG